MTRRRLDAELVRRGLVVSRAEAQAAVRDGLVVVAGRPAVKPSWLVDVADALVLARPARRFVSRGGEKLAAALDRFAIDPRGRECLDAGASTGGFTDCLLTRRASHVVAVDVGYGQLAWSLRQDERVSVLERTNVRDLQPAMLPYAPSLIVGDLSFISLTLVVPALAGVAAARADAVLLVKPQFEAGAHEVGRGGVVRDPAVWRKAIERAMAGCAATGLRPVAVMPSPLRGPAGNVEFPLHLVHGEATGGPDVEAALEEAERLVESGPVGDRVDGSTT